MKLDKSKYIVQELVEKGLLPDDKVEEAIKVISNEGKFNKEYQTKQTILKYLETYSNSLVKEADLEAVYSAIQAKFKEDAELTSEDIKTQAHNYLNKEGKYNDKYKLPAYVDLVDEFFTSFPFPKVYVRKL